MKETQATADLQSDVVTQTMCSVTLPANAAASEITLTITDDQTPPPDAILFGYTDGLASAVPSSVQSKAVVGLLPGAGAFGITHAPTSPSFGGDIGASTPMSDTIADTLRNLEANAFSAAFFDGSHLIVGNGARVLIYSGLPHLGDLPSVVLGQPEFDSVSGATTSASSFGSAGVGGIWSDGTKLIVSNGSRVLIWRTFPAANFVPADLVLGQTDFSSNTPNVGGSVGASTLSGATEIDSDGTRLLVADTWNYRVLEWASFPTTLAQVPDAIIGQPNSTSAVPNAGATPLYLPYGASLLGTRAYVSGIGGPGLRIVDDVSQNNSPSSEFVFCWPSGPDFAPSCAEIGRPAAIRSSPAGGVAVRDWSGRLLLTSSAPSGPSLPSFVIGQPDPFRIVTVTSGDAYGTNGARVHASNLGNGYDIGGASGDKLLLPDGRRLLIWSHFPTYNFEPADTVLGQAGFATNELTDYRNVTASTLAEPSGVAVNGPVTAVSDTSNNRVLLFHTSALIASAPQAFAVLGQSDAKSFVANHDLNTVDAAALAGPRGVCLDGKHLVIADTENHRVLIWNSVPQQTGTPADVVLGQVDFAGRRPNHGNGDVSPKDGFSDVDARGLFYPTGVACDGVHLAVSDQANNRVLLWNQFPTANGQAADAVLGQPSFTSVGANGGAGPFTIAGNGLDLPSGLAFDGTSLWIADTENNRVVLWTNVFTAPAPAAWLGQPNGSSVTNPNYQFAPGPFQGYAAPQPSTTATSVVRPYGLTIVGGTLYVSETDSNRLHAFDKQSLTPTAIVGQVDDSTATANAGGVSARSLSEPMGLASDGTNLWLADSRNSRVLGYPLTGLSSGAAAAFFVGQSSPFGSGFNAATSAAGGAVSQPAGIRLTSAGELFATDPNNNRVLVFDTTATPPAVKAVIGQTDTNANAPNAGGTVGAAGMSGPRGVWADAASVLVADTQNNRVLVFNRAASISTASVVLGQGSMNASSANAGGISASSMLSPGDVCSDGTRVAVVDTGNNRVLVWNAIPTQNGQPADAVLGQPTASTGAPNLGTGSAGINTIASPSGCVFAPEGLYVADTGNNRVLLFEQLSNGAYASAVLGQLDSGSRVPAASVDDTGHFAGPSGLAFDGVNLYVADRDLKRIVVVRDPKSGGAVRSVLSGTSQGYVPANGIAVARTPFFTSTLFASDAASHRVFRVTSVSRLGNAP